MHFKSDIEKQKQNKTHAHMYSAFSHSRAITRDQADWKTFQQSGAWSQTWQCIALDVYADLTFVKMCAIISFAVGFVISHWSKSIRSRILFYWRGYWLQAWYVTIYTNNIHSGVKVRSDVLLLGYKGLQRFGYEVPINLYPFQWRTSRKKRWKDSSVVAMNDAWSDRLFLVCSRVTRQPC